MVVKKLLKKPKSNAVEKWLQKLVVDNVKSR